jgi:minor extracellular serine protease Vpr
MRRACALLSAGVLFLGVAGWDLDSLAGGIDTDVGGADQGSVVTSTLWFVELPSRPLAEAGAVDRATYLAGLQMEKQAFRSTAASAGLRFEERFTYDLLWNGLSVKIAPADLLRLSRLPGVAALYPVGLEAPPEPAIPLTPDAYSPDLYTAITMTGADQVQATGITGAGVTVGVIDTGIDYNHPDLGGGFGPGHRVVGGYDFVGDDYTGDNTPMPDPDPMDCAGHGTHVAGIVGADGGVKGVAPGVTFRAYRVFGCEGGTTDDVLLKALELALSDGVQVINMSLGAPYGWPQYPIARASDSLVNHGVVVVAAAGNAGGTGLYSMGAPGVGQKVIGVGSVDNNKVHSPAFQLGSGPLIGYQPMSGAQAPPREGTFDIVDAGLACGSLSSAVAGRVALISRGTCSFRVKALNAVRAGAGAALIYNNSSGLFLGTVGSPPIALPVASMSREDGLVVLSQLPSTLTWTSRFADVLNPTGGLISSFSAYGLSPDLALKPDITAPGGLIFSTLPLAQGGYGLLSGTSMSSPHVAGTAALLLEAHPRTPSQAVRDILQNSAVPGRFAGNAGGSGQLDNTHRQGAGLVDIKAAIDATTKVTPGKLSLGETEGAPVTRTIQIENDSANDVIYDLSHHPALASLPGTFTVHFDLGEAAATFSSPTVTAPAGGSASVDIMISEPANLPDQGIFGGYIVLTPEGSGRALRVPYSGFKGDYQSILVLNPAASRFGNPLLRATLDIGASGAITIHPADKELAYILYHLDHQVRRLRLEVFGAATGRAFGRVGEIDYLERSSTPSEFFALAWDGTDRFGRSLRSGEYALRLSIEKALGQDDDPAAWEIWTSPVVTVVRPATPGARPRNRMSGRGSTPAAGSTVRPRVP